MRVSHWLVIFFVCVYVEILVELGDNLFWLRAESVFRVKSYDKVIVALVDFDDFFEVFLCLDFAFFDKNAAFCVLYVDCSV